MGTEYQYGGVNRYIYTQTAVLGAGKCAKERL
jgi:hypothetical protein